MKVLFDQGTPAPLRKELKHHEVSTAHELGWSTLENGELLSAAENAGFELFVTTDRNLQYQQNLSDRKIAVVVLSTTSWPRIRAESSLMVSSINEVIPNSYVEINISDRTK